VKFSIIMASLRRSAFGEEGVIWQAIDTAVAANINLALFDDDEFVDYRALAKKAKNEAYEMIEGSPYDGYSYGYLLALATLVVRNTIFRHPYFDGWCVKGSSSTVASDSNVIIDTIASMKIYE
jgi:hypothetical protein